MVKVFLKPGQPTPNNVQLGDPTVQPNPGPLPRNQFPRFVKQFKRKILRFKVIRGLFPAAVVSPVTWDPSNKSANVTLSNGNLTATCNTSASATLVRATASQSAGKYYCEGTIGTNAGSNDGFGICNATQSMSSTTLWLGHDGNPSNGTGNYAGLQYLNNGSFVPSTPPMGAGATFGMAVDFTNKKIWWWNPTAAGQSGGEWNGDVLANQNPATNTGGLDMSVAHPLTGFGTGTAFFPACDLETLNNALTANFGASAYAIQGTALASSIAGFQNWNGTSISSPLSSGIMVPRVRPKRLIPRPKFLSGWRFRPKTILKPIVPISSGIMVPHVRPRKILPRPKFLNGWRFRPTKYVANTPPLVPGAQKKLPTLKVRRRKPLKVSFRHILPQLVAPAKPQKLRKLGFRPRKLRRPIFLPKHWSVIGQHAIPSHPPIAAGLWTKRLRPKIRRIIRWKALKKTFELSLLTTPIKITAFYGYGGYPGGAGPYGAAGQVTVLGPPIIPPVKVGTLFYGYGGLPGGAGPYGAAGQVLNPPPLPVPLQGSHVTPSGPIRVAQPYVSVVRVKQPTLASTRKAAPNLQQVRKTPPNLTD